MLFFLPDSSALVGEGILFNYSTLQPQFNIKNQKLLQKFTIAKAKNSYENLKLIILPKQISPQNSKLSAKHSLHEKNIQKFIFTFPLQ